MTIAKFVIYSVPPLAGEGCDTQELKVLDLVVPANEDPRLWAEGMIGVVSAQHGGRHTQVWDIF